jgi:hypothetical protein
VPQLGGDQHGIVEYDPITVHVDIDILDARISQATINHLGKLLAREIRRRRRWVRLRNERKGTRQHTSLVHGHDL